MNKKDLQVIIAYAECMGYTNKSVEFVLNMLHTVDNYVLQNPDEFLDTYRAIKMLKFEAECFTLMRTGNYSIWMAAEDWDLPMTAKEADEYLSDNNPIFNN